MAKKKTVTITETNFQFENTLKSKDTDYVYNVNSKQKVNFFVGDIDPSKYSASNRYYRDNDDLVILTTFTNLKTWKHVKTITSTFKNYFNNVYAGPIYQSETYKTFDKDDSNINKPTLKPENLIYDGVLEGKEYTKSEDTLTAIIGNNKSNTYNIEYKGGTKIYDEKGSETYNLSLRYGSSGVADANIVDIEGNEKYTLANVSKAHITDNSGKDVYDINNVTGGISDRNGNDKYTVNNKDAGAVELKITEYKGSDKYDLTQANNVVIAEKSGNDSYTIKDTAGNTGGFTITEETGNDNYSFTNVKGNDYYNYKVYDYEGKDTYTISGASGSDTIKHLEIFDGYQVVDQKASGNDTYNLNDASYVDITDRGGNDKFNLKGSTNHITITSNGNCKDKTNNDTYNVSGAATVIYENDYRSSDTYNISDYDETSARDDRTVRDQGGSDKYTIKNTELVTILDTQLEDADGKYKNTFTVSNTKDAIIEVSGPNYESEITSGYKQTSDTYNITATAGSIRDYNRKSADTYNISSYNDKTDEKLYVSDRGGSDKYTIKNAQKLVVTDYQHKDANDKNEYKNTFSVTNSQDFQINMSGYELEDIGVYQATNDTYNVTSSNNGGIYDFGDTSADTYTIAKSGTGGGEYDGVRVDDIGGSDTYTLKDSGAVTIYDYQLAGNDGDYKNKFNITNVKSLDISVSDSISDDEEHEYISQSTDDTYNVTSSMGSICDYSGKSADTYTISKSGKGEEAELWVRDYGGSDTYTVKNSGWVTIVDDQTTGNDGQYENTFNVSNTDYILIGHHVRGLHDDVSTNDTYNISSSNGYIYDDDDKSADKYNLTKYNGISDEWEDCSRVTDNGGSDEYTLKSCKNIYIRDTQSTEGTYTNTFTIDKTTNFEIKMSGYDSDDIFDYEATNDTYKVTSSSGVIYDYNAKSSDTYEFTDYKPIKEIYKSEEVRYETAICDYGGSDTYTVKNSDWFGIRDIQLTGGVDDYTNEFNVTNVKKFEIAVGDYDNEADVSTDDTYNITKSAGLIEDFNEVSCDTYNLDKLALIGKKKGFVTILDCGGNDDVLNIAGSKAENLVFMTNYAWHENSDFQIGGYYADWDASLIIYDKKTKGFVKINECYSPDGYEVYNDGFGYGEIETIKAGGTEIAGVPDGEDFNAVHQEVAGWLYAHSKKFDSVVDVLQNGSKSQINELIACFQSNLN